VLVAGGCRSTNQELLKRVRVAYDNRLDELVNELDQLDDKPCRCPSNSVDKSSTLSEKRLDVLLRQLNHLKTANVSNVNQNTLVVLSTSAACFNIVILLCLSK